MPAQGVHLLTGKRVRLLSRRHPLFRNFKRDTGIDIDLNTFKKIIRTTCKKMGDSIANDPAGIVLPEIGYLVVTKYKPKKPLISRTLSKKYNKPIPFLNLQTFGYVFKIKWFKAGMRVKNVGLYNLKTIRNVKSQVKKNILGKVNFFEWKSSDLWSATGIDRLFNKTYKQE